MPCFAPFIGATNNYCHNRRSRLKTVCCDSTKAIGELLKSASGHFTLLKNNCFPLNSSHRHTQDFSVSSSIPTRSFQSTPKRLWSDTRASNVMRCRRMFSPSPTLHIDPCCKVSLSLVNCNLYLEHVLLLL